MMETWQELKVTVKREGEELVSNLLIELGAQGVAIEDSMDYVGNMDRFGEIFPEVEQQEEIVVTAYYPDTVDVTVVEADLQARLAELTDFMDLGELKIGTTALAEEDWADNWKKYYEPARITHDLTIVPSWTDYEATAGEMIIKLDPGMAFGTGTHPTTKMSLFALEQVLRGGETVLDVGTGSGVLSIASSLLGAKEIFAYDLDDVAVRVAQENIELNPGMENIHVAAGDLLKGVEIEADVIVANILADILIHLIDDAYDLVMKSVEPLGQEYCQEVARYQEECWVDFAANSGKDSGGYAADPYRVHPYVLMSWTGRLSDVYTLIHEIGHSGQFIFSDNHQSYFNAHMSTYYVEAPSTFNELLLSDYLENQSNDPRQKRFALAHRLTDTYFHNFITHLLEAAFQRKVYTLIEEGETFGASKLNSIMKEVLTDFWGDAIEIDDDAALTWMRQAHYYMGLYSYTYSAGLVISTAGYLHLKNSETGAEDWLNLLKSGGSKTPLESAMIIGADISTDKPLRDTIQFLSDTVDQIIAYSAELGE